MVDFKRAQDRPKERTKLHPPKRVSAFSTILPPIVDHINAIHWQIKSNSSSIFHFIFPQVTIKVSTSLLRYYSNIFDHDANVMFFRCILQDDDESKPSNLSARVKNTLQLMAAAEHLVGTNLQRQSSTLGIIIVASPAATISSFIIIGPIPIVISFFVARFQDVADHGYLIATEFPFLVPESNVDDVDKVFQWLFSFFKDKKDS